MLMGWKYREGESWEGRFPVRSDPVGDLSYCYMTTKCIDGCRAGRGMGEWACNVYGFPNA